MSNLSFYNMHPPFGKPVLLLPLRRCMLSLSCIWLPLGELLHILHPLAPTYHDQAIMKARKFIPKKYSLTCTALHSDQMQHFWVGPVVIVMMHFGRGGWIQHVSSTMKLGPTPLRRWCLISGCAWYPRHPTARPQLHLATKHKTAPLPINAAFWCGRFPDAIWKFLKNEGCMPSPPFHHQNITPHYQKPFFLRENLLFIRNHLNKKQPFLAGFCIPRWIKRG